MAALISRRGAETTSVRRLGRRFWVPFLAACVIVFGLEKLFDYLVETEGLPGITQSIFSVSGIYQRLVAAPRVPLPRYTQIIEVNQANDPRAIALTDLCGQREMITRLLKNVARAVPKAIVLDKYFEPSARPCPN